MGFSVKFISRENNKKFGVSTEVNALDELAETRAAIGVDVPADRISDEIEFLNDGYVREIGEAEARAFGGFEKVLFRTIIVDGFVQKYRKVRYDITKQEGAETIAYVIPFFDFDALFKDWKAAGCPDTLTITED